MHRYVNETNGYSVLYIICVLCLTRGSLQNTTNPSKSDVFSLLNLKRAFCDGQKLFIIVKQSKSKKSNPSTVCWGSLNSK